MSAQYYANYANLLHLGRNVYTQHKFNNGPDDECRHHKVYYTFTICDQSSAGQTCTLECILYTVLIENEVNTSHRKC